MKSCSTAFSLLYVHNYVHTYIHTGFFVRGKGGFCPPQMTLPLLNYSALKSRKLITANVLLDLLLCLPTLHQTVDAYVNDLVLGIIYELSNAKKTLHHLGVSCFGNLRTIPILTNLRPSFVNS